MKKYILFFGFIFIVSYKQTELPALESFICFQNPQPINDSELKKIPGKFLGVFMNTDSVFLVINSNCILTEKLERVKVHKLILDSLKTDFIIQNGKYILKETKQIYTPRIINDSVELTSKNTDTIFVFSNTQKAKRINGTLIISQKQSFYWYSKIFNIENSILKIRQINSDNDLQRLDSLTVQKSKELDSATFLVAPTRREFAKILNLKNLGHEQQFNKISE